MVRINVQNLSKSFKDTVALDEVSFCVNEGEIFGFLGPSGAGKTTTINILTNQLK
ncbi:ATP-binding cassette domain-containing protein, partial [Streptococcus gallolyticus]